MGPGVIVQIAELYILIGALPSIAVSDDIQKKVVRGPGTTSEKTC